MAGAVKTVKYADFLEEEVKRRESDRAIATERTGALGESLARAGLSQSGYGDYLNGVALASRVSEREKARADTLAAGADLHQSRLQALAQEKQAALDAEDAAIEAEQAASKEAAQKRREVLDDILSMKLSYEDALLYANQMGLSEEDAESIAQAGSQLASSINENALSTEMSSIISRIFYSGLYGKNAETYAMLCGISEEDAEKIGEIAEIYYKYVSRYNGFNSGFSTENWQNQNN